MRWILPILCVALLCAGCTLNTITFEKDSITPEFDMEPTGADETGGASGGTASSQGKLSPAGSANLDGMAQFCVMIWQSGETPTTPSTDIKIDPEVIP